MIITGLGASLSLAQVLAHVAFWQRKEYRLDRTWAHFTSGLHEPASRSYISSLIVFDVAWLLYIEGYVIAAQWLGLLELVALFLNHAYRVYRRGLARPTLTLKALLITLFALLLTLAATAFIVTVEVYPLQWVTLVLATPFLVALAVFVVNIPSAIRKRQIIRQARQKRATLTDLVAVGITGSFGKTSTKHFLAHIVNQADQPWAATTDHRNSELVVAQDMLRQLDSDSRIYIAEMAAYKRGEIKALAALVQPQVGCITAISNQHVALFGSLYALAETKWELVEALPTTGVAVLNADDEVITSRAAGLPQRVVWYSTLNLADVYVDKIQVKSWDLTATLHIGAFKSPIKLPLVSDTLLSSVLAAVACAWVLKIPPKTILKSLATLQVPPQTMERREGLHDTTVIDDSYSANEQGVLKALGHLTSIPAQHKVVVMVPLIELGALGREVHTRISQALSKTGARVYVFGTAYQEELGSAFPHRRQITCVADPKSLRQLLARELEPGSLVLLEGRLPDVVRSVFI